MLGMNNQKFGIEESSEGSVGLLISLLVRYPEVSTIKYDPDLRELRFAFMVSRLLPGDEFARFTEYLEASLDAYSFIADREDYTLSVKREVYDDLTMVEIVRDVESLSQEEISLIIGLIQERFTKDLLVDDGELLLEDDFDVQDDIIDHMLDSLKDAKNGRKLIGIREEGRVMVFNKPSTPPAPEG